MIDKNKKHINKKEIMFFIIIFVVMFYFFNNLHPVLICDTDDWQYIAFSRHAWPKWGDWNPTRVLPEVLMGAVSLFGSKVIYPLLGNFTIAMSLSFAIVIAFIITIYVYFFYSFIKDKYNLDSIFCIFLSSLFLVLHFVVFRRFESNNLHLFLSINACTYFFYTIPNMLSSIIVLKLLKDDFLYNPIEKYEDYCNNPLTYGVLVILIYFSLFSNLYASCIIGIFIGIQLLNDLLHTIRKKNTIVDFLKKNILRIIIVVIWIGVQVFELFGGRANNLSLDNQTIPFFELIKDSIENYLFLLSTTNKLLLILIVFTMVFFAFDLIKKIIIIDKSKNELLATIVLSSFLVLVYLLLVNSKASTNYSQRPDAMFGVYFYLFLLLEVLIISICIPRKIYKLFVPLAVVLLLVECNTTKVTYRDSYSSALNKEQILSFNDYLIDEFKRNEEKGKTEFELHVPYFNNDTNWPFGTYAGNYVSNSMFKHGLISREIKVTKVVPDIAINKKLNIIVPKK